MSQLMATQGQSIHSAVMASRRPREQQPDALDIDSATHARDFATGSERTLRNESRTPSRYRQSTVASTQRSRVPRNKGLASPPLAAQPSAAQPLAARSSALQPSSPQVQTARSPSAREDELSITEEIAERRSVMAERKAYRDSLPARAQTVGGQASSETGAGPQSCSTRSGRIETVKEQTRGGIAGSSWTSPIPRKAFVSDASEEDTETTAGPSQTSDTIGQSPDDRPQRAESSRLPPRQSMQTERALPGVVPRPPGECYNIFEEAYEAMQRAKEEPKEVPINEDEEIPARADSAWGRSSELVEPSGVRQRLGQTKATFSDDVDDAVADPDLEKSLEDTMDWVRDTILEEPNAPTPCANARKAFRDAKQSAQFVRLERHRQRFQKAADDRDPEFADAQVFYKALCPQDDPSRHNFRPEEWPTGSFYTPGVEDGLVWAHERQGSNKGTAKAGLDQNQKPVPATNVGADSYLVELAKFKYPWTLPTDWSHVPAMVHDNLPMVLPPSAEGSSLMSGLQRIARGSIQSFVFQILTWNGWRTRDDRPLAADCPKDVREFCKYFKPTDEVLHNAQQRSELNAWRGPEPLLLWTNMEFVDLCEQIVWAHICSLRGLEQERQEAIIHISRHSVMKKPDDDEASAFDSDEEIEDAENEIRPNRPRRSKTRVWREKLSARFGKSFRSRGTYNMSGGTTISDDTSGPSNDQGCRHGTKSFRSRWKSRSEEVVGTRGGEGAGMSSYARSAKSISRTASRWTLLVEEKIKTRLSLSRTDRNQSSVDVNEDSTS